MRPVSFFKHRQGSRITRGTPRLSVGKLGYPVDWERIARWSIFAGVSLWAANQLWMVVRVTAVLTGHGEALGLDPYRIELIEGLGLMETGTALASGLIYPVAAALIALRSRWCPHVYAVALLLDLGSWLSYSMNFAYDQLAQAAFDWAINAGLLIAMLGLLVLAQRRHFSGPG